MLAAGESLEFFALIVEHGKRRDREREHGGTTGLAQAGSARPVPALCGGTGLAIGAWSG